MIDFRYHLVSLVSVFLALAVGIVLGAGPLKGNIGDTLNSQVAALRAEAADLRTQVKTGQGAVDNRDTFMRSVTPSLVAQQLGGESVVVVTLPGADADAVKPLQQALATAGARVTGRIDVKQAWVAADRAADRDTVLASLGAGVPAAGSPAAPPSTAAASPAPSVTGAPSAAAGLAGLLGRAALTTDPSAATTLDAGRTALLDGLRKAGLIAVDNNTLAGPATEAVVLVPPVQAATGQATATSSGAESVVPSWEVLAIGLDTHSSGVVVAGPASSATSGGVIAAIRGQDTLVRTLSTVDTGGTPMGDVTTVLALHEQAAGGSGSYGFVGDVDAPLPSRSVPAAAP